MPSPPITSLRPKGCEPSSPNISLYFPSDSSKDRGPRCIAIDDRFSFRKLFAFSSTSLILLSFGPLTVTLHFCSSPLIFAATSAVKPLKPAGHLAVLEKTSRIASRASASSSSVVSTSLSLV